MTDNKRQNRNNNKNNNNDDFGNDYIWIFAFSFPGSYAAPVRDNLVSHEFDIFLNLFMMTNCYYNYI